MREEGQGGENRRICASTRPCSFSCLPSSSCSSSQPSNCEMLTGPHLRRKTRRICAQEHKLWVVKMVLPWVAWNKLRKLWVSPYFLVQNGSNRSILLHSALVRCAWV